MIKPVRIQRKRTKGFDLQAASPNGLPVIYVGRPGDFGNPFSIGDTLHFDGDKSLYINQANCLQLFEIWAKQQAELYPKWLEPLRGHNLACWCSLDSPCHADILLQILAEGEGK